MSKKASDPLVDEAPGLGDTEALFPPFPDAVPVAAKLLHEAAHLLAWRCAGFVCTSRRSVWDTERNDKQDKVLPLGKCPASGGSISNSVSDPRSSSRRPLRCPPRTAHHSLHAK